MIDCYLYLIKVIFMKWKVFYSQNGVFYYKVGNNIFIKMILVRRMGSKLNPSAKYYFSNKNHMTTTILTQHTLFKHSSSKSLLPLVSTLSNNHKVDWNLNLISSQQCNIECLIILNNQDFNKEWLQKALTQANNLILADGGANILFDEIL